MTSRSYETNLVIGISNRHEGIFMKLLCKGIGFAVLVAMSGSVFLSPTRAQVPAESPLGSYGKLSTFCGEKAIPRNEPTIPQVGCFYLSAGHRATGTFAKHRVEVSVDDAGTEIFAVDGTRIVDAHDTATWTNLPFVSVGGVAGYSICEGPTDRRSGCPSNINIFSKDTSKTVLFLVSKCFAPEYRFCVSSQESWDYESSRKH
jgi:hypothetical protein